MKMLIPTEMHIICSINVIILKLELKMTMLTLCRRLRTSLPTQCNLVIIYIGHDSKELIVKALPLYILAPYLS